MPFPHNFAQNLPFKRGNFDIVGDPTALIDSPRHISYFAVLILTEPDEVTAANTVDEYGAQATSPTALFRSNVNIGSLQRKTGQ